MQIEFSFRKSKKERNRIFFIYEDMFVKQIITILLVPKNK